MQVVTKLVKQNQKTNSWPEFYTCNFLTPGLVSYTDVGAGVANLPLETILKMLPSFKGRPVIIDHKDVTEKDYSDYAVGYITKVWWESMSGWAMCDFILTDDKAKEKVAKGYSVSCAYDSVITDNKKGEKNAVPYDETILDGVGNHLALVTSPRYEEARISPCMMLVNSKKATITKENIVIVKVNKVERICDTCEYLAQGKCSVAGPGGKITQRYADERILGQVKECSAYEKAKERRENFVIVKVQNDKYKCQKCGRVFLSTTRVPGNCPDCSSSDVEKVKGK